MSFPAAVRSVLTQYATFQGRARRAEFWWFYLFSQLVLAVTFVVVGITAVVLGDAAGAGVGFLTVALPTLVMLALLVPSLAVSVRRLHDTGRSGLWFLLSLVPIVNFVFLVFTLLEGQPGPNQYGPDPKGVVTAPVMS